MIRVWHSYSCNNSSSYRLVARFADAASAKAVGDELVGLLAGLADRRHSGFGALAEIYGFTTWRDNGMGGGEDGPNVAVDGETLIVHHDYCLGLGPGVPAYLQERGARSIDKETWTDVHVSVMFRAPAGLDPRLDEELASLIALLADNTERVVSQFQAPWAHERANGKIAFFRDAGTAGLFFPIDARDLVRLRAWFADRGIENPIVRIEAYEDQDLYVALAAARCSACDGAVEYLDPRLHDIETAQVVCKPCGGLYDVNAFLQEQP